MRSALVFGASGQIGRPLLVRLRRRGWQVLAVSRRDQADMPGVRWLRGDLATIGGLPPHVDAIFSCGPLDHFARWYAQAAIGCPRVVAFGSTSAAVKRASADAAERALAARLAEAERALAGSAEACGARCTVLRPALVYGAGRDLTLSRIATMARRHGAFVLPRGATGLRQPVHVDDLAAAAMAALDAPALAATYDLPGGETLPYREMVRRVLAALDPPARLVELPAPMFSALAAALRATGRLQGFGAQAQARLREDLVFDVARAAADLGYAPRPFRPDAATFAPR